LNETVVIAGAGHAAGQLVASLRQKNFAGEIILLGDEAYLPYQRPPLSKKYLAGELDADRLLFKPATFYEDDALQVRLDTRVSNISRDAMTVATEDGRNFAYNKLVLALGSRARRLPVPGEDLPGVHYLRGIDDVNGLRESVTAGNKIVIVGAGYIGLEVAAVCCRLGLDVTVVEMADRVMSRVVSPQVSDFFQQVHEQAGVKFRLSTGLTALHGSDRVTSVEVEHGDSLPADTVLIGAGIVPNYELAEACGLDVDNGIVVDDRCQSSDSKIWAIGDCTSHPSSIYGRRIRLESVHNALEQAKTAASNICDIDDRYSQVPWFWSDQYDLKLQIAGLSAGYDQVVIRGVPDDRKFACFYLRDGSLIAVDAINSPREFMQSKRLIATRTVIDPEVLANPEGDLTQDRS
jgi:3-phenylpropionate/trans-cinnamate dioxygenase ferredoxin reductase subunit